MAEKIQVGVGRCIGVAGGIVSCRTGYTSILCGSRVHKLGSETWPCLFFQATHTSSSD